MHDPRLASSGSGRWSFGSGPKGIRTPDLLAASQALYQLSYGPAGWSVYPDDIAPGSSQGTSGASRHSRSRS
jgi:hypothetical protein